MSSGLASWGCFSCGAFAPNSEQSTLLRVAELILGMETQRKVSFPPHHWLPSSDSQGEETVGTIE